MSTQIVVSYIASHVSCAVSDMRNLVVMSDGGFQRQRQHGSGAWVIFSVESSGLKLIHFKYTYIAKARSAFQCEVIAMVEAIAKAKDFIFRRSKFARIAE